ncbi:glutamate--cysteine ligase catalytic subunit-like isoform X2 [Octopus sinensis]|uniref:Glutamate--cysteine ligase n=1 Tax=Octopus sinensis TaxID=2607531 RepID=A0A6P7TLC8_9MOLL|nr:glutamate--cysteine ligase catalytic subunit-like isoform X2 [Octopus sinensis]
MISATDHSFLTWEEIEPLIPHIKDQSRMQFVHLYRKYKDQNNYPFYWGDEIEFSLIQFDHDQKVVQLLLNSMSLLESPEVKGLESSEWVPECLEYILEGIPKNPFGSSITDLNLTEEHFKERRKAIKQLLSPNQTLVSVPYFPRFGCPNFTFPSYKANKHPVELHQSVFIGDAALCSQTPYYITSYKNLAKRRQERMVINVPLYIDKNTMMPYGEDLSEYEDNEEMMKALKPGHIYMDTKSFGVSCCVIQVTFQAAGLKEAAYLFDNFVPLTPIMTALTAGSPIYRGLLSEFDSAWRPMSWSCDDRTRQERGIEPLTEGKVLVDKTGFDSIGRYISVDNQFYNDYDYRYDHRQYELLKAEGIDEIIAKYVAHLLLKDPLILRKEKIDQDIFKDSGHIQAIFNSNGHSLKLKLPDEKSGWKVEFRTMEDQLTDFENAALVVFLILLNRAIITLKLNLLIPITKVDENFTSAQKRDAINKEKFHFRKDVQKEFANCELTDDIYTLMTLDEIMNGKDDFPGLIPLIHKYLNQFDYDASKRLQIMQYLKYISDKAAGETIHLFSSILNKFYLKYTTFTLQ